MASAEFIRQIGHQPWLSIGLRRRVVDRLTRQSADTFETEMFGQRYVGRLDSYIDREVFYFGAYDQATVTLLRALAGQRTAPVLLDIGANVGVHTLGSANAFAKIHAFEPYPPLVSVLTEHVKMNGLSQVAIHAVGLGEVDTTAEYAAPADDRSGYGGFDNHDPQLRKFSLPMRRGDGYFTEQGIDRADVIKIDVEGSERRVIDGMQAFLFACRPALVFEGWPHNWTDGYAAALPPRYRTWQLVETTSFLRVFGRFKLSLGPAAAARGGDTIVALPDEWPVPAGVTVTGAS